MRGIDTDQRATGASMLIIIFLVIGYWVGKAVPTSQVPEQITIVKSDDSDWAISDRNHPDTVMVDTVIIANEFNHLDTTYQTRYYKNISHE